MFIGSGLFVFFLLLAVLVPVVLWQLVESETADEQVVDRDAAERQVRSDDGVSLRGEDAGTDGDDEPRGWEFENR